MQTPSYMKWLPGTTTATLSRIELLARGIMEGFVAGRHHSPRKGISIEFAEHRQYTRGDDLRRLDWRIYARKDRYYVKQFVEETNLRATVLLDISGSMAYRGDLAAMRDNRRLSKLEYSQYIAAVLSYILIGQQDAVGMATFDNALRTYLPSKARPSQIRHILEVIDRSTAGKDTNLAPVLHDIAERIPRRGLVIILSDLFDNAEEILKALHHFRFRRHEVILFHVMAEEEVNFPFENFTMFKDLESDAQIPASPKTIRAEYLDRMRTFLNTISKGCGNIDVDYVPVNTKIPFEKTLTDYLIRRRQSGS